MNILAFKIFNNFLDLLLTIVARRGSLGQRGRGE